MINSNLMAVLRAREEHVQRIDKLCKAYGKSVIAAKMNIPGPAKSHPLYTLALDVCHGEIRDRLNQQRTTVLYDAIQKTEMGDTFYLVVDLDAIALKQICMTIEESHTLGRLFDIDVYDAEGLSLSRNDNGQNQRKCLLCEETAHACARSRKHQLDELINHIHMKISTYLGGEVSCLETMNKSE